MAEKSVRQNAKDELLAQAMLVQAHIKKTLILHHTMSIYMGEKKELQPKSLIFRIIVAYSKN